MLKMLLTDGLAQTYLFKDGEPVELAQPETCQELLSQLKNLVHPIAVELPLEDVSFKESKPSITFYTR